MAYEDLNNLPKRTACEKVLRGEAFDIAKNPKYDEYQRVLTSIVCKFFDEKASDKNKGTGINSESKELAKELHKLIIDNLEDEKYIHLL